MELKLCKLCTNFDPEAFPIFVDDVVVGFMPVPKHHHVHGMTGCMVFPTCYTKGYPYGNPSSCQIDSIPCIEFIPDLKEVLDALKAVAKKQKILLVMMETAVQATADKDGDDNA